VSESLVHGWDMAQGAGVPYAPDKAVVESLLLANLGNAGATPPGDMFAAAVATEPGAPPLTVLLGLLGRRA